MVELSVAQRTWRTVQGLVASDFEVQFANPDGAPAFADENLGMVIHRLSPWQKGIAACDGRRLPRISEILIVMSARPKAPQAPKSRSIGPKFSCGGSFGSCRFVGCRDSIAEFLCGTQGASR
ncbi:hypothetical protein mosaic partial protein (plasmid) [Cupriavidus metallidurans CH34]|uniref:Uncharacterized protein n=1 Tax=Cupriavidus metallidurans (strain ATCC 43123 / DSM 2839 / NBRC 102507 / CH34) TaxID=266264 RepID=D3DYJ0_CUPMC|nr:hypothetical protein mosaic partial protein [Cupriavidus metallidurans CH34]